MVLTICFQTLGRSLVTAFGKLGARESDLANLEKTSAKVSKIFWKSEPSPHLRPESNLAPVYFVKFAFFQFPTTPLRVQNKAVTKKAVQKLFTEHFACKKSCKNLFTCSPESFIQFITWTVFLKKLSYTEVRKKIKEKNWKKAATSHVESDAHARWGKGKRALSFLIMLTSLAGKRFCSQIVRFWNSSESYYQEQQNWGALDSDNGKTESFTIVLLFYR